VESKALTGVKKMSARDKIILLSALVIIVGGALVINGRFNAELTRGNAQSKSTSQSPAFTRELSLRDIDTLNDARGAVEAIREKIAAPAIQEPVAAPNAQASLPQQQLPIRTMEEIDKQAVAAVRAAVEIPAPKPPAAPQQSPVATGSTYTVKKGQTLTDIAIAVYSDDKSNAIKNAKKIYEFNKDILPSIDRIREGQVLRLPPDTTVKNEDTSMLRQLADAVQEKVQYMSSKYVPNSKGKLYVVKQGDSLWKIAQNSLGNGARYKEIVEANKDILENSNRLSPGMAIIIPN
jgi:nucleoid-associated protein YgaU